MIELTVGGLITHCYEAAGMLPVDRDVAAYVGSWLVRVSQRCWSGVA